MVLTCRHPVSSINSKQLHYHGRQSFVKLGWRGNSQRPLPDLDREVEFFRRCFPSLELWHGGRYDSILSISAVLEVLFLTSRPLSIITIELVLELEICRGLACLGLVDSVATFSLFPASRRFNLNIDDVLENLLRKNELSLLAAFCLLMCSVIAKHRNSPKTVVGI